jgi:putative FmdB family regulatory protein
MPIYEYQCQQCGHHHEALQKISDAQLRQCPECGRKSLKRLVSAVRFRLAGSGWYETDFKSDKELKRNLHEKGDKEEAKPESAPATDSVAKSDGKEPAKAAAKADAAASAKGESSDGGKRIMVTRPPSAPARPKATDGRKPVRRTPAVRSRRR